jgi:hypothetical protein
MTKQRFEEIEKRNSNDKVKLCFELYCETFGQIPYEQFIQLFQAWLGMFAGKSIEQAIEYFKNNKVT